MPQEFTYANDVDLELIHAHQRHALRSLCRSMNVSPCPRRLPRAHQHIVRDVASVVLRVGRPPGTAAA